MEINQDTLEIEIVKVRSIESGIEVFLRAWSDEEQIGFGTDGSVDIERFRIINPPILVPDEKGDVVRTITNEQTGETTEIRYREDAEQALLQSIEHTLLVLKNVHNSENIVSGKRGNTTSTFYPAAGANSPVDGRVGRGGNETFSNKRNNTTGTYTTVTGASASSPSLYSIASTDIYSALARTIFGFDTSILGSDTITSATLSIRGIGGKSTGLGDTNFEIVSASPASPSNITNSDYNIANFGSTAFSSGVTIGGMSIAAYTNFTLNASGISHINKTGNTFFGGLLGFDFNNSAPTWVASSFTGIDVAFAETSGTINDPKLVVEHEAGANPRGGILLSW